MHLKSTCLVLLSGLLAVSCTVVDESIKKGLPKEVIESLDLIESILDRDLSFPSVAKAREFIRSCHQLRNAADYLDEDASKEILKLVEEPRVVEVCNVSEDTLDTLEVLDDDGSSENLSPSTVYKVKGFRIMMEQKKVLKTMFSQLVNQKLSRMGLKMMKFAIEDTPILFGETKFGWTGETTLTGCELKEVSKICSIAARTSPKSKVNGDDFAHLRDSIKSNAGFLNDSDRQQLEKSCKSVMPNLMLFRYIDDYQEADLLHDSEIKRMSEGSQQFNFYYQLKNLCSALE